RRTASPGSQARDRPPHRSIGDRGATGAPHRHAVAAKRCAVHGVAAGDLAGRDDRQAPALPAGPAVRLIAGHPASALAAMFTVSASSVALKKNEITPCAVTTRRIGLAVTATSDTCDVMPMTSEK